MSTGIYIFTKMREEYGSMKTSQKKTQVNVEQKEGVERKDIGDEGETFKFFF
jgi:hypothetical protein